MGLEDELYDRQKFPLLIRKVQRVGGLKQNQNFSNRRDEARNYLKTKKSLFLQLHALHGEFIGSNPKKKLLQ